VIEIADPAAMRAWSREQRRAGRRVGFVPTMGFLHEGHLRLIDGARAAADVVVISAFVNPLQFGPNEDFTQYPRDVERDRTLAAGRGATCCFAPSTDAMYGEAPVVRVIPGELANHLCGPFRPGHFQGVLTVVAKLFHIVEPDVALFGRKDAQQALMVRRMVFDLDFPVVVTVAPTVREQDGLALSSRNVYLDPAARGAAPRIARTLDHASAAFRRGVTDAARLLADARAALAAEPLFKVEYVELVDPERLAPEPTAAATSILAVAVWLGRTRLIDNVILGEGTGNDERVEPASP
jgi:pantoate--beta-alanine ligase